MDDRPPERMPRTTAPRGHRASEATAPAVPSPPVPASVQLADKLGEIVAVLAFCALAYVGKLSGEWAVVASLTALGVQSIPRGILAARSGGATPPGAALGLIGLGLLAAMHMNSAHAAASHDVPTETQRAGQRGYITLGLLVILTALGLVATTIMGCPNLPPVSGCVQGEQRCENDAPEVCSGSGRWTPVGSITCGDVNGVCVVGITAHCVPRDGGL